MSATRPSALTMTAFVLTAALVFAVAASPVLHVAALIFA